MNRRRMLALGMLEQAEASEAFAPSGMTIWWDGSDAATLFQDAERTTPVTADGQTVLGGSDKSGNANHFTGDELLYKVNIQNGKSVLRFSTYVVTGADVAHGIGIGNFYLIFGMSVGPPAERYFWWNGLSFSTLVEGAGGSSALALRVEEEIKTFTDLTPAAGNHIVEFWREDGIAKCKLDGVLSATTHDISALNLANTVNYFGEAVLDLFEFQLYNTLPSAEYRTSLYTYLTDKWGLS